MRTSTKPNADSVIARKVDDEDEFCFCAHGADVTGMSKVDDESEAFKGHSFKEVAVPQLGMRSARVNTARNTSHT